MFAWFLFSSESGLAAWHVTGDRSNAGGVVGGVGGGPGAQDEVFLAAHEAAQAQRDSQGRLILASFHMPLTPVTIGTRNWHTLNSDPRCLLI